MTRPLPSRDLAINLLREIADGIESEGAPIGGSGKVVSPEGEGDTEHIARQVAPKISGAEFKSRLAQRRQAPDQSERTKEQEQPAKRRRKTPGR